MKNQTKKAYQAPQLIVHGDAAQLTQQTNSGLRTDAAFTAGTLLTDVTAKLS